VRRGKGRHHHHVHIHIDVGRNRRRSGRGGGVVCGDERLHGAHGGFDGDAGPLEGDVLVKDVGERDGRPLGRLLGGAVDAPGVGAECGERGVEAVVGEVAVDEECDLRGGDLLLAGGRVGGSGGLGIGRRRRHGWWCGAGVAFFSWIGCGGCGIRVMWWIGDLV